MDWVPIVAVGASVLAAALAWVFIRIQVQRSKRLQKELEEVRF